MMVDGRWAVENVRCLEYMTLATDLNYYVVITNEQYYLLTF